MANLDFGKYETSVGAANVSKLAQLFQVPLADAPDGAPVGVNGVPTPMGMKDLIFVVGRRGTLMAFDAATGAAVWHASFAGATTSNSAPAIDPNRQYVYVNGNDGMLHRVQVSDGTEVKAGGWPISNGDETPGGLVKPSGQLAIGTDSAGTSYLYASNNGHGHVTIVNLSTGSKHIFNLACSNMPDIDPPPGCDAGANPWARSPVFLPDLQKVFVGTGTNDGSGKWVAGQIWRTSWVALPPDGHTTMMAGGGYPLDSYTPADWQGVVGGDRDTSVGGLIPVPSGYSSKYPHLGIQPGKDTMIRILNLADLSGQGGPGHLGGEIKQVAGNMGLLRAWGAIWMNPANKVAWIFIGGGNGLVAFSIDLDPTGVPNLTPRWTKPNGSTTAPFVANGVLYAASPSTMQAIDPATGNVLWSAPIGAHHWSSPIMMSGVLYMADVNLTAWAVK
jgi:outer membrane protein assembly factor BamB